MEEYCVMAKMEATFRVKDNTGFDMTEYKQRRTLLEDQRRQEEEQQQYYSKPKPKLPEVKSFWDDCSSGSYRTNNGSSRPEEPPLPFTRANRRFVRNARARSRVPEICPGFVLPTTTTTALSNREHIVKCWGCVCALRVNVLATLVQCPNCLTVSPVTGMMPKSKKL